jgi:hypothetical protein
MGSGYEIGRALKRVIELGHPPAVAWGYTPRELYGWLEFDFRDRLANQAELLSLLTSSRGDPKEVAKLIKRFRDESQ